MVKAGGNLECLADLCGCVMAGGCGVDLLRFGSCRSIGLLEQVVKVVEQMLAD